MTEETTQEQAAPQQPELNLNDLAAIRNLIEVVTARGVFKATELSAAGALFDKLNTFLEAAQKAAQPATQETQETQGA